MLRYCTNAQHAETHRAQVRGLANRDGERTAVEPRDDAPYIQTRIRGFSYPKQVRSSLNPKPFLQGLRAR